MGYLFVVEGLVDHSITAIDITLLKVKGPVWHKSSMGKGILPRPGIDTDAKWGYSRTKDGSGYKLHLTSAAGNLVVPLTADVTTNVPDNKMYIPLTSSVFSLPPLRYMTSDPGYDAKKLYGYSKKTLGIDLLCPVKRYKSSSKKRLERVYFYQSTLGHVIYD